MPESRFRPIAVLLILIAAFAIYGGILSPVHTFAGMDFHNLNFPRVALTQRAVGAGVIPLWNWHEWGGAPLFAALQGAIAYPLTWVTWAMPLPYGLQVFVFAHLLIAGAGTYCFARRVFRLDAVAAAFSAVAYMGNAFFVGRIEQFQIVAVNCLVPWFFLAAWLAVMRRRFSLGLAVVWALMLVAGHPQFAVLGFLGIGTFLGMAMLLNYRTTGVRWGRLGFRMIRAAGLMLLGSALAAVQLVPSWELGRLSERIWPYPDPTAPELSWGDLPALLIPRYYNLMTGEAGVVLGFTELGLYAGVLTVPLAVAGVIMAVRGGGRLTAVAWGRQRTLMISAGVVWLTSMVIALGKNGYVATFLYESMPLLSQSRGAARSLNVASLMLAVMAGMGVHRVAESLAGGGLADGRRWRVSAGGVAVGLVVLTTLDLAINHGEGLRLKMTPVVHAEARPLVPRAVAEDVGVTGGRIYRFMAFDSDLYLNNAPAGVAERNARLQPNQSSIASLYLTDGYEEGLLPTRNHANLYRNYNRNFRDSSPDAALLAVVGARYMLTEYEILPDPEIWSVASEAYLRGDIVPSMGAGMRPGYRWWKSAYGPGLFLSPERLWRYVDLEDVLRRAAVEFPVNTVSRRETSRERREHAFSWMTPEIFDESANGFSRENGYGWNSLTARAEEASTAALVLLSPHPGWKVSEKNGMRGKIKPLNSLMYAIESEDQFKVSAPIILSFDPFSFRLGLFISLCAFSFTLFFVISGCISNQTQKRCNP